MALFEVFLSYRKKKNTIILHILKNTLDAKKRWTEKTTKSVQKNHWSGSVGEGLFLSKVGPKRRCLSYLIEIRAIFHISDFYFLIISIRYDRHPLFGPAFIKMKHSTTRPNQCFFCTKISPSFFKISTTVCKALRF